MPAEPARCVILGGGGHARVVIDALQENGAAIPAVVLDANRELWGTDLLGVPIRGGDDRLPALAREGITHFVVGVGGIGDNGPRKRLFDLAREHGLRPLMVRHPSAVCSRRATIGDGTVVLPGAVINAGARVGMNVIVNSGAIIEHDCVVGDHAHVATGAKLCSTVRVGNLAHVGAGAVVRQCLTIGAGAVVGAGAAVVKDVPAGVTVFGVPAEPADSITSGVFDLQQQGQKLG